jgi:asparagine synthase (glutamine-hydrolysing)
MCGIAGWIGTVHGGEQISNRMSQSLRHRGPDDQGIYLSREVCLVHTRLSILDLSPTGAQPMANEDGTVWTVFNGEIYNHHELRRGLEARGHKFLGRSDGEVLPHLYEEEGIEFVAKLRGMFAFAIYDTRRRALFLARDRFGIKPLFYAPARDRIAFASEIRTLLEFPDIDRRPDRQAVYDFAALFYIPAPETFYSGIRALQPGEIIAAQLELNSVSWKTRRYKKWAITPDQEMTFAQAVDRADTLITEAVHRQMESDAPLGTLLSGGIDSSLISAVAQGAREGGIRTFNVRFPEKEYDETWAAEAVSKHIGSRHTTLDMEGIKGTWEHITSLLEHAGQPFADTSLFAVNAVCRLMRQHVKVALSGDGGDEGFGGYDIYWQLARIANLQRLPLPVWRGAAVGLAPLVRCGLLPAHWPQRFDQLAGADDVKVVQDLFTWVRQEEQRRLCLDDGKALPTRRLFESQWEHDLPRGSSRLERLSALATEANVRLVLPNDFLFKVDTASMRESLEVRVPMLDEDLFELGMRLPHALKVDGRACKIVLRGVAQRWLPRSVAQKPKRGFGVPVDSWVDAELRAQVRESLLGRTSRISEFFRPEGYRPIIEAFCDGRPYEDISRLGIHQRVIMLLSVQLALERHAT